MKAFACRLPEWASKEIEKIAEEKGLAFATTARCIIVEHLKENAPAESHRPIKESVPA